MYKLSILIFFVLTIFFKNFLKIFAHETSSLKVIAHRGSSGALPENSLAAFELAILSGSDYLESDIILSKDGELFIRHEPNIINSTNIIDKPEFLDRATYYSIDYSPQTYGYYTINFTSSEIKDLKVRQVNTFRNLSFNDMFDIPTVEDYLCLILRANVWREWLTFEALKWNNNFSSIQYFDWTISNQMKILLNTKGKNSTIFTKCLKGIQFSSEQNCTIPISFIDSREVFTYLKPNLETEHPLNLFRDLINSFFPSTNLNIFVSNNTMNTNICNSPETNLINSYFPNEESANKFLLDFSHPFKALIEIKSSAWHNNMLNLSILNILKEQLEVLQFNSFPTYAFIQSFDKSDLVWFKSHTDYPINQLVIEYPNTTTATHFTSYYDEEKNNTNLLIETANTTAIIDYAIGIGPSKSLLLPTDPITNYSLTVSHYLEEWKSAGLLIFIYTFRNEYFYIPINYNHDPYMEMLRFYELGVHALISDFPLTLSNFKSCKNIS